MGQKVNPVGLRIGINRTWDFSWYARDNYATKLQQDLKIQELVQNKLASAGVSSVKIERPAKKTRVIISASRPGMIIGKKGGDLEKLKQSLESIVSDEVIINIVEERKPETNAVLVADAIARQLEKRVAFRKAAKRAIQLAMRMGAKGIKVAIAGRLNGAEIARTEMYKEGRVPLHTLRARIEYGIARAQTTYGVIGVKVWVYKGDDVEKSLNENKVNNSVVD